MVYCGKPSANCDNCKARKRRYHNACDKAVPSCGQCLRMGQVCPGYRDTSGLVFRNETKRVIDRARARSRISSNDASMEEVSVESTHSPEVPLCSSTSGHDMQVWQTSLSVTPVARNESDTPALSDVDIQSLCDIDWPDFPEIQAFHTPSSFSTVQLPTASVSAATLQETLQTPNSSGFSTAGNGSILFPRQQSELMPLQLYMPKISDENFRELGVNYFLANYVLDASGPSMGYLEYTTDFLDRKHPDASLVEAAVRAVGLAGLANITSNTTITRKARSSYVEALQKVNKALLQPKEAKRDSVVLVIILLGLFESITCTSDSSIDAWSRHIDGASRLLVNRGTSQFTTRRGLHIFQESISHLLQTCSRIGEPIPPRIRLLRLEAAGLIPDLSPAWTLSSAHIEAMSLYHSVDPEKKEPFLERTWEGLLMQAVEMDRKLQAFFGNLPPSWQFKRVHDPHASPAAVYQGNFHIYYDVWVAKIWDGMRSYRIMLGQVISCLLQREGLVWAAHDVTEGGVYAGIRAKVTETTIRMRDDIFASVPQMLGFVHYDASTAATFLDCGSYNSFSPSCRAPAIGAYSLLWHLYLAGALSINPPETRAWAIDRLHVIRNTTGIQKAQYLAESLESTVDTFEVG